MDRLTNIELMEIYSKAKELKCSKDFLVLLRREMERRNIQEIWFSVLEKTS